MPNKFPVATSNPSAFSLTTTQVSGNNRLGVSNVQNMPNVLNPKSLGQPSANGYTSLPTNPKYTPYTNYTSKQPIVNQSQAIQTQARAVPNGLNMLGKGLGLFGLAVGALEAGQNFGNGFGYLWNLPQNIRNESEKNRLDNLLKQREAQSIDNSRINNASTGNIDPPFTGGQGVGISYTLLFYRTGGSQNNTDLREDGSPIYGDARPLWISVAAVGSQIGSRISAENALSLASGGGFLGAIGGIVSDTIRQDSSLAPLRDIVIATGNGNITVSFASNSGFVFGGESYVPYDYSFVGAFRRDGQAETPPPSQKFPPSPAPAPYPSPDNWYYGNVEVKVTGNALDLSKKLWEGQGIDPFTKPTVKPFTSPDPIPSPDPIGDRKPSTPPVIRQPNGFPQVQPQQQQQQQSSTTTSNKNSGVQPAYVSPARVQPAFVSKPFVGGVSNPSDMGKAIDLNTGVERSQFGVVPPSPQPNYNNVNQVKPNSPTPTPDTRPPNTTPTTPPQNNNNAQTIAQLLGLTALVTALKIGSDAFVNASLPKINTIEANTTPTAQQTNAKQGVCDAMQPDQCGFEGVKQATTEATNPIKDVATANNGLLSLINTALSAFIAFAQSAFGKILNILNNTVIDRSLAVMNLAANIHNAAMLTRDIGETLGSVVDNVISLTGLRFTNSEGSQVQFTDFIGANFRSFLVSILGVENYTSLVLNWQKANTIYHSAMAVVNTTQSMLDPISSAVEYGMENVSKIGNSLKEDGVVSENAYPAMDETIRARRVNRFERLNDTLEGAENIASNLSSITSSAVSVKEDYKQLREDTKELKDKASAFNTADSEARAALKAELPTEITAITLAPAPAEDEE